MAQFSPKIKKGLYVRHNQRRARASSANLELVADTSKADWEAFVAECDPEDLGETKRQEIANQIRAEFAKRLPEPARQTVDDIARIIERLKRAKKQWLVLADTKRVSGKKAKGKRGTKKPSALPVKVNVPLLEAERAGRTYGQFAIHLRVPRSTLYNIFRRKVTSAGTAASIEKKLGKSIQF